MPDAHATATGVAARDPQGHIVFERPPTPLEMAISEREAALPSTLWLVHPVCADPPAVSGVCTLRFPDGAYWCFRCRVAWVPPEELPRGEPVEAHPRPTPTSALPEPVKLRSLRALRVAQERPAGVRRGLLGACSQGHLTSWHLAGAPWCELCWWQSQDGRRVGAALKAVNGVASGEQDDA